MDKQKITFGELYFSFRGRINRSTYILRGWLPLVIFSWGGMLIDIFTDITPFGVIAGAFGVIQLLPNMALVWKRLHDRGRSGWFVLLSLIPLVGIWVAIELFFLKGNEGENPFDAVRAAKFRAVPVVALWLICSVLLSVGNWYLLSGVQAVSLPDEELIRRVRDEWQTAFKAGDLEGLMALYIGDDAGKARMREVLESLLALEKMEVRYLPGFSSIDGNEAFMPMVLEGNFVTDAFSVDNYGLAVAFTFERGNNNNWRLTCNSVESEYAYSLATPDDKICHLLTFDLEAMVTSAQREAWGQIVILYLDGKQEAALEGFRKLQRRYPENEDYFMAGLEADSLEFFVKKVLSDAIETIVGLEGIEDIEDVENISLRLISSSIDTLLRRAYMEWAIFEEDKAAEHEIFARRIYDAYQSSQGGSSRLALPEFSEMQMMSLLNILKDPEIPPLWQKILLSRLEEENPDLIEKIKKAMDDRILDR